MKKKGFLIAFLSVVFFSLVLLSTAEAHHHGRVILRDKDSRSVEVSHARAIVARAVLPILGILDRRGFLIDGGECDPCDDTGSYSVNDGYLPYTPLDIQSTSSLYPYTSYPTVSVATNDGEYHVGPPLGVPFQGFPYLGGFSSGGSPSGSSTPIVPTTGGKKSPYDDMPSTYPKPSNFPGTFTITPETPGSQPSTSQPSTSQPSTYQPSTPQQSTSPSQSIGLGTGDRPASGPGSEEHAVTNVPY